MDNLLPVDGQLYFTPDFFTPQEANQLFQELFQTISWKQEPIRIMGREIMQPRLTAWYGDPGTEYTYSGITMTPLPWVNALLVIKARVEEGSGQKFNSALLNLYRHGEDSMGWHSDNERSLGRNPVIASVSFGATRKFKLKHREHADYKLDLHLNSGSLVIMAGETQHRWYHSIPKEKKVELPRINITFRKIFSESPRRLVQ